MIISMKTEQDIIANTIRFVKEKMKDLSPSHGWDHVKRVMKISEKIAQAEKADPLIVKLSAILHDVARLECDKTGGKSCHAELLNKGIANENPTES